MSFGADIDPVMKRVMMCLFGIEKECGDGTI